MRPLPAARPAVPGTPPDGRWAAHEPEPAADPAQSFVGTSGRIFRHVADLGLETHVSVPPHVLARQEGGFTGLPTELQAIVAVCAQSISIAEVAARLRLHLDVAKVMVADLRAAGYLEVHQISALSPIDPDTILRVIHGLRDLS
jgi:hypothetical protein